MAESPTTRASLLVRIRDPQDSKAWGEFVDLYAPLIYRYGCKHGLQDADAADLTQDILQTISRKMPDWEYDSRRGSFRGWLFTIVRNRLRDHLDRCHKQVQGTGDTEMQQRLESQPEVAEESWWEQEYQRHLLSKTAEQIRGEFQEKTWQAFWLTTVEGKNGKDTAAELGLSVAAVYLAKSRIMARLKEIIRQWEE